MDADCGRCVAHLPEVAACPEGGDSVRAAVGRVEDDIELDGRKGVRVRSLRGETDLDGLIRRSFMLRNRCNTNRCEEDTEECTERERAVGRNTTDCGHFDASSV